MSLRVSFVGHDASRSGAPLLLLWFLRWLTARHPEVRTDLLLLDGGPLEAHYQAVVPTRTVARRTRAGRLVESGLTSVGGVRSAAFTGRIRSRVAGWGLRRSDLVVVNTLAALAEVGPELGPDPVLVCLVHELDGVAERTLAGERRRRAVERVDRFVAAGPAVAEMLIRRWGVRDSRVRSVDPFVDLSDPPGSTPIAGQETPVLVETPPGGLVVSVGSVGARKGTDRFIDLLASWPRGSSAPTGCWVGGDHTVTGWAEACFDLEASGLGDRCRLVPTVADPRPWMQAADVVVSVAREDPYPLSLLEAAAAGVPVVAMDAGGARHMLAPVAELDLVVAQGDVLGLRDRVNALITDRSLAARVGARLHQEVAPRHLVDVGAPRWWNAMRTA